MIRRCRARLSHDERDAGLSLVELLAASFISLLMLTLVGGMFVQVTRLTAGGESTKTATAVAWTVLNEVSSAIRQAAQVPVSSTGTTEGGVLAGSGTTTLVVDSYDGTSVTAGQTAVLPARITFSVDGSGNVVAQRVVGAFANGFYTFTAAGTSRVVNGPVVTTGAGTDALFVYYSGTGSTLTQIVPGASGLTSAQAGQVTTVGVNVVVSSNAAGGPDPVKLTNLITMPNVAIVNGGN